MCYVVIPTSKFEDDIRYYVKKCKFKNIEDDISAIVDELEKGNLVGDIISDLHLDTGESSYKVRMANTDTKVGKSNGYRIIYYAIKNEREIYLLTIYYKKEDIKILTKKEIKDLIEKYCK